MNKDQYGISHLSGMPTTVTYAVIILVAVLGLALLRHFSLHATATA
jgi:hypothetical protein